MRTLKKLLPVGGLVVLLGGCAGLELDKARSVEPVGSDFNKALYSQYLNRAQVEFSEGDYVNADLFAAKAQAAARDELVLPEDPADHALPAKKEKTFVAARSRLIEVLDADARVRFPELAAETQLAYDCWLEEQEENRQDTDIRDCRVRFDRAFLELKELMRPKMAAAATVAPAEPVEEEAVVEEPEAPAPPITPAFFVFFDFDSAKLDAKAQQTVNQVAELIRKKEPKRVFVTGHADRAGDAEYNLRLSEKRAQAVARALVRAGVPEDILITGALGEADLRVDTPDGARERQNRYVQITLIP